MNLVKTHIEIFCSTKLWLKFISQHPPEQRGRVMSYQAESQSTINEVLLLIAVLQRIPKNRWVSSTEIRKGLAAEGIDLMPRRLQRFLCIGSFFCRGYSLSARFGLLHAYGF